MLDRASAVQQVIEARRLGFTLRESAALAGVHVATICRWQAGDPELRHALDEAALEGSRRQFRLQPRRRRRVLWHRDCPLCGARAVVRTAHWLLRFWRCRRWPVCRWASWRPRARQDCARCGAPCYWSHSRISIACSACRMRIMPP